MTAVMSCHGRGKHCFKVGVHIYTCIQGWSGGVREGGGGNYS